MIKNKEYEYAGQMLLLKGEHGKHPDYEDNRQA
jgi:hypothetical protein